MKTSIFLLRVRKLAQIIRHLSLMRVLFRHKVLAGVEHKPVLNRSLKTIVDVGANRGQFSLAARIFANAKVFAFEPIPSVANVFAKIFTDDPQVKVFASAIGENFEQKLMHLSSSDDSSSLLEIGVGQLSHFPGTKEVGTLSVSVAPLDHFLTKVEIHRPAMLKIDVQGFELQVLKGCMSLISSFDFIYCECSFIELYRDQALAGEIVAFLSNSGFHLAGIYNPTYDANGFCIQADLLFQPLN